MNTVCILFDIKKLTSPIHKVSILKNYQFLDVITCEPLVLKPGFSVGNLMRDYVDGGCHCTSELCFTNDNVSYYWCKYLINELHNIHNNSFLLNWFVVYATKYGTYQRNVLRVCMYVC